MIDLAQADRGVAVLGEVLVERDGCGPAFPPAGDVVGPFTGVFGIKARHQRHATGAADGLVAVGPVEFQTRCGQAVEVRCDGPSAVAAQFRPQVIDCDEQDVGTLLAGRGRVVCRQTSGCSDEQQQCEGVMAEHGVARPGKHLKTDHRVLLGGLVQLDPGDLGDKLIECRERDGGVDGVSR